jgi:choice-of-anchor B domain-containing protein
MKLRSVRVGVLCFVVLLFYFSTTHSVPKYLTESLPCRNGKSGTFDCKNVDLQAWIPLDQFSTSPSEASNIWGYVDLDDQREYAIIGLSNGTAVVDVTAPTKPHVVGVVPALESSWREVKVYSFQNPKTQKWDAYAYITTEARQGLQIIDLSELPSKVSLARVDREIKTSHTAFISNVDFATGVAVPGLTPNLYVEGADAFLPRTGSEIREIPQRPSRSCTNRACGSKFPGSVCTCGNLCSCAVKKANPGFHVFSLEKPRNPKIIGSYTETYMHDVYVESFTKEKARQCAPGHDPCEVVFGWTGGDFRVIDWTEKSNPIVLGTLEYSRLGYAHSGWIAANKRSIFGFDEFDEVGEGIRTRVLTIDITDLRNPSLKNEWLGSTNAIDHNGYVYKKKLYISSYSRGLTILNVKNPSSPKEIGFFDTYPEHDQPQFRGAWGVYPFLPSGNILVSDINRGLFILKEQ